MKKMIVSVVIGFAVSVAAGAQSRPKGPCDIYAAGKTPCVAAHSTTRALYASYNGVLYRVVRESDGKALDIGVVPRFGYADSAAQDKFCANTYCWMTTIYDQSAKHNDMTQAPRGGFSGPALGGFNNVPIADMAPVMIMGHKVYGVFIEPGMGLRIDDPKGTAVDDQAEGQYWVINGQHFNSGCCFDYGNAEIDSRDDDNGTMETAYFGDAPYWFHGTSTGPWIMTDQENNLVGCVNPEGSKQCNLPSITWRFVTAIAKGEPHHWTSMGGDAQRGALAVMFDGPRVDATYDPMRKQGAILLGNGGDNSDSSQGTFFEGAVTAAGTFPSDATDQQVQANIVDAGYRELPLSLGTKTGAISMSPGATRQMTLTFTNTTDSPAEKVRLNVLLPKGWVAAEKEKTFSAVVAAGAGVNATFSITSGSTPFNGDVLAETSWASGGTAHSERLAQKVRSVSQVKINEFRISSGPPANATDSFIELYNASDNAVDISNWTLTEHPSQQAIFSTVKIPANTSLASHGFYLLGLSNSGLAAAAKPGDNTIYVRNTKGMKVGDTVTIGSGVDAETHKIATVGTAAADRTTIWQPLPDGPILTIPPGSANLPVTSVSALEVGERVALGYGAKYPTVPGGTEQFEVVTITQVGKPGTQAYLAADAPAGTNNIKVTSLANISRGDKIRLDIDAVGHGIETVTVTHVGTAAKHTNLAAPAKKDATSVTVRDAHEFSAGDSIVIGTPANKESVSVTSAKQSRSGPRGVGTIEFTPALQGSHIADEGVISPGTGLDLAGALHFPHAANLPFSDRGTGIAFQPATRFPHISNEPVQALGTGLVLDAALSKRHGVDAVVRDGAVTNAGYQGSSEPNQWFGGPELTAASPLFGRTVTLREGSIVLRDANGLVGDSLDYGSLVDPWAAAGDQSVSGPGKSGCFVVAPGVRGGAEPLAALGANASAGRFPDGRDTGSNCTDFASTPATFLSAITTHGTNNIKVASVEGFAPGQAIQVDSGANLETAVIAQVGTPGAANIDAAVEAGALVLHVPNTMSFNDGQAVTVGTGADAETATIANTTSWAGRITLSAPLAHAHASGTEVSGTGLSLKAPLSRDHARESAVIGRPPTPGAPNQYSAAAP